MIRVATTSHGTSSAGYDLSLEYYFPKGGVASVGVFRKDISDFWGVFADPPTAELLEQLGLDPSFAGADPPFTLETRLNVGDARITGAEFNYQQPLAQFGEWGKNLNVFANATKLDLEGPNQADFAKFIEESASWGITWSPKPMVVSLKWNYRGRQRLNAQSSAVYGGSSSVGFREYFAPRAFLDLNFEYQFSRRFTAFLNGRNILDKEQTLQRYNDVSPAYSRNYNIESFGVQWALGIKGTF
ncbi:MAG: TonB-dependent receptor domain-containing protein [Opitutaceae bacterium]